MRIPEEYRERYDNLARSHPWMREMADEQPPEGDAVAIMRKIAADKTDVSSDDLLRYAVGADMVPDALDTLADMVERDYVSREVYDSLQSRFIAMNALPDKQVIESLEKQRDEALEIRDKALGDAATFKAERDELKAEIVSLMQKKQPYTFNPEAPIENIRTACRYIDELTAERDEWKAKAEGSSEVRAGSSDDGVKRSMTNLDAQLADHESALFVALDCEHCAYSYGPNFYCRFDNVKDVDYDTCERGHREWLLTPHLDDCGQNADMSEKGADCVRSDGGMSENDNHEKLESDALMLVDNLQMYGFKYAGDAEREIIELLDRQAAIDRKEFETILEEIQECMRNGSR